MLSNPALYGPRSISIWPAVVIGGAYLTSILLIPSYEHYYRGALTWAATILAVGLLTPILISAIRNQDAVLRVENILYFGVVYWLLLDPIQGSYDLWGASIEGVLRSFHSIAIFSLGIWAGGVAASLVRPEVPQVSNPEVSADLVFGVAILFFLLAMLRVFIGCELSMICIAEGLYAPRFESPWSSVNVPGFNTLLHRFMLLGYLILPFSLILFALERRATWKVIITFFLGIFFLLVLIQDGGRRQVGMVLGATALVWLLLNRPLGLKKYILVILFLVGVIYLLNFMLEVRKQGISSGFGEVLGEEIWSDTSLIRVDKNLYYFSRIASVVPEVHPYTMWDGVYSVVAAPIPRSVLPSKPPHNAFPLQLYIDVRKGPGWSWTCSAVCDLYLIGGYVSVFIGGLVFGGLAYFGNTLLSRPVTIKKVLIFSLLVMVLFVSLRAMRELVTVGMALIVVLVLFSAYRSFFKRRAGDRGRSSSLL